MVRMHKPWPRVVEKDAVRSRGHGQCRARRASGRGLRRTTTTRQVGSAYMLARHIHALRVPVNVAHDKCSVAHPCPCIPRQVRLRRRGHDASVASWLQSRRIYAVRVPLSPHAHCPSGRVLTKWRCTVGGSNCSAMHLIHCCSLRVNLALNI